MHSLHLLAALALAMPQCAIGFISRLGIVTRSALGTQTRSHRPTERKRSQLGRVACIGLGGELEDDEEEIYYEGPDPIFRYMDMDDSDCLKFMRDGHIYVEGLFNSNMLTNDLLPDVKKHYENKRLTAYQHAVKVLIPEEDVESLTLDECETKLSAMESDNVPFMQLFNMWLTSPAAQAVVASPQLAKIAAQLLGCDTVRLYQDSLFIKRPGDGPTRWHSDLHMAPFDANEMVTCWIPLQYVPPQEDGGSSLSFASGSHRDFALGFWSDPVFTDLTGRYDEVTYDSFRVGDCSFHHGWCLHSAPGNDLEETRYAFAVTYIGGTPNLLKEEGHLRYPDNEDSQSYASWIEDIGWGGIAEHPQLPIVYMTEEAAAEKQEKEARLESEIFGSDAAEYDSYDPSDELMLEDGFLEESGLRIKNGVLETDGEGGIICIDGLVAGVSDGEDVPGEGQESENAGAGVDAETPIYIDEDDNPIANGGESDPEAFQ